MSTSSTRFLTSLLLAAPVLLSACASTAEEPVLPPDQESFASPEEAMSALLAAARADDAAGLTAIFGPENAELLRDDDPAAQKLARMEFCAAADESTILQPVGDDMVEMVLGEAGWPSPIPIVRAEGRWYFDAEEGIDEIVSRRVGRNELEAIDLCRSYLDAQYLYRNRDWDEDGVHEYAQVIQSSPGQFDGLFWEYDEAGTMPLCPLDGVVTENEIYFEDRELGSPWFGYFVKILTRQGPGAPGGAREYIQAGNMTGGFALIAWPAEHGSTGVMSFMVSQHGTVYQKDLGSNSRIVAAAVDTFDPSGGWSPVE